MPSIVLIAGSPAAASRSAAVLATVGELLTAGGAQITTLAVRDLPAEDLVHGRYNSPAIQAASAIVQQASAVVVATPVYKAAYSGVLKAFLDLLPAGVLNGRAALPIVTGGAPTHALAVEYALTPVLLALGAAQVLAGVYVLDSQIQQGEAQTISLDAPSEQRLRQATADLLAASRAAR